MSDEFPICSNSNCGEIDSLRNVTATYPQVWKKEQIEELEKNLWCVECKQMISKKGLKYIHSKEE